MKKFWLIALFVLAISISTFAQKPSPEPKWEIAFGKSWGRVHQNYIRQIVSSDRWKSYQEEGYTPIDFPSTGTISENEFHEITELINRLNLPQAKKIPTNEFNKCIVSPHLPNVYFSLRLDNKEYHLSHCNEYGGKNRTYEYTLNLSIAQKAIYKSLRKKLESLFDDKIKQYGTVRQDENPKKIDILPISVRKVWLVKIFSQREVYASPRDYFPLLYITTYWRGRLTRRGNSFVFDAVWRNEQTGKKVRDTVTLVNAVRGRVLLWRKGAEKEKLEKIFRGTYHIPTVIAGSNGNLKWQVNIESETASKR